MKETEQIAGFGPHKRPHMGLVFLKGSEMAAPLIFLQVPIVEFRENSRLQATDIALTVRTSAVEIAST